MSSPSRCLREVDQWFRNHEFFGRLPPPVLQSYSDSAYSDSEHNDEESEIDHDTPDRDHDTPDRDHDTPDRDHDTLDRDRNSIRRDLARFDDPGDLTQSSNEDVDDESESDILEEFAELSDEEDFDELDVEFGFNKRKYYSFSDDEPDDESDNESDDTSIPNPPDGLGCPTTNNLDGPFIPASSHKDLHQQVNLWAKQYGFAVTCRNGRKRRGPDKSFSRYTIFCDRYGTALPSTAKLRTTTTKKCGCKWRGIAKRSDNGGWTFNNDTNPIHQVHNHLRSFHASAHSHHRQLGPKEKEIIESAALLPSIRPREITKMIVDQVPGSMVTRRDIYNYIAKTRRKALQGYTATGALFRSMDHYGVPYRARFAAEDSDRLEMAVWTDLNVVKHLEKHSEVLYIDMTHATNRYNLPFYQAITQTNCGTNLCLHFGVAENEEEESFRRLFRATKEIRDDLGVKDPEVIITDFCAAMKNALADIFPNAQQQLCIFHILKNLLLNAKKKWVKDGSILIIDSDDEEERQRVEWSTAAELNNQDITFLTDLRAHIDGDEGNAPLPTGNDVIHTAHGFVRYFKLVMFARTEQALLRSWNQMVKGYPLQQPTLSYIIKTLFPVREQWAHCYTKRYTNFGGRVTSPSESANLAVKSYLITGRGDLLKLQDCTAALVFEQIKTWKQAKAKQQLRIRFEHLGKQWLGKLPYLVTLKALELIIREFRHALAGLSLKEGVPPKKPLKPCSLDCTVRDQFGVPCRHQIFRKLEKGEALSISDVHSYWVIGKPLGDKNKYYQVKNPRTVPRKGRPRNDPLAMIRGAKIPTKPLILPGAGRSTTSSNKRGTQQSQKSRRTGLNPGPIQGNAARLAPSVRRQRSQWELVSDEEVQAASEEADEEEEVVVLGTAEEEQEEEEVVVRGTAEEEQEEEAPRIQIRFKARKRPGLLCVGDQGLPKRRKIRSRTGNTTVDEPQTDSNMGMASNSTMTKSGRVVVPTTKRLYADVSYSRGRR